MIDAVLSYHLNPQTCGIAKFNQRLALELGVPCRDLRAPKFCQHPLVSVSPKEIPLDTLPDFGRDRFDLFLHAWMGTALDVEWLTRAHPLRVVAANGVIADQLRQYRPDVITAWCPSTIRGNAHRGSINILTFGMAHKIQQDKHEKLKRLLDATGEDYTISVSTAVHEGSPWSQLGDAFGGLWGVYRDRLRCLGFLADDAIAKELAECTAVALFFDPALRANNTTAWTVLDAGKILITNRDPHSPTYTGWNMIDITGLTGWPNADVLAKWSTWPNPSAAPSWSDLKGLLTHVLAPAALVRV